MKMLVPALVLGHGLARFFLDCMNPEYWCRRWSGACWVGQVWCCSGGVRCLRHCNPESKHSLNADAQLQSAAAAAEYIRRMREHMKSSGFRCSKDGEARTAKTPSPGNVASSSPSPPLTPDYNCAVRHSSNWIRGVVGYHVCFTVLLRMRSYKVPGSNPGEFTFCWPF